MKRHRKIEVLYDVFFVFTLRMKLIMKDKTTLLVMLSAIILFAMVIQSLTISAEDQSTIPIGVIDYDDSKGSRELVVKLKKVPNLKIIVKEEEELYKLLLDEMITSYFVLEEGFGRNIIDGKLKDIITMHYLEDNKSVSIISDIIAGEMMYSVCFYKGLRLYESIPYEHTKHTAQEYTDYMNRILESSKDFNFAFDIIFSDLEKNVISEGPISNAILYNQLIIGILGILIAFIAMFLTAGMVRDKELGVKRRLKISYFSDIKQDIGGFTALLLTEGVITLVFSLLIFNQMQVRDIKLWASLYLLMLLNALVQGGIFLFLSKLVKSMILYQMLGSTLILLAGGFGFYQLLTGFYQSFADKLIKVIPNNWFIQGFTDIIIYGKTDGYIKEGHWMLLNLAVVVIVFILIYDLKHYKKNSNYSVAKKFEWISSSFMKK